MRNARALFVCAVASHLDGDTAGAERLEERAEDMRMEGLGHVLDTPRMRLALVRDDLESAERLLAEPMPVRGWHRGWLLISTHATHLDALAALGRRQQIEAWPRVRPNTYVEPFHLRALGAVREDEEALTRALVRFEAMGLHWHAAETAVLLGDAGARR